MLAAAIVLAVTALLHSVLGELLILRKLDARVGFPRFLKSDTLAKQTVHASWHVPSVLAIPIVVVLARAPSDPVVVETIVASLVGCGVIFLVGTRARHPGWIAFFAAAALAWAGR